MKRLLVIISVLLLAATSSAQSVESLLLQLDDAVQEKETYYRNKEERIAAIRSSIAGIVEKNRYDIYNTLYDEYAKFNLDSAINYARKKLAIASANGNKEDTDQSLMHLADIYINAGLYNEAEDLVRQVQTRSSYYYHTLHTLYSAMSSTAVLRDRADTYANLKEIYRDSLIQSQNAGNIGYVYSTAEKLSEQGRYDEALQLLSNRYNDPLLQNSEKAILDYCMAVAYKGLGNREKAKWHYAASAIADKKTPVKEYRSLQELAFMLYEDGDLKRAYNYISCAMEDVQSSNVQLRTVEFAPFMSTISTAYEKDIRHRARIQQRLLLALAGLLVLLTLVAILAIRQRNATIRSNRRLMDVNQELTDISRQLQETGYLKDEYLYQYMEQASANIDRLDAFRRKTLVECRKQGADRLASTLEASFDSESEMRLFHRNFDETFLHLFPTFVEDVNRLLKPEMQLEPKPGRLLNTELRILALIRLGVTDNVKMAHFLRTSLSTIYNYRSKLRNAARSDAGIFEEEVAKIGEIKID